MSLELSDCCFIIAEAGTAHLGSEDLALQYVQAAAKSGANAVKFQMFYNPNPETMFCWIDGDAARAERWRQSALSLGQWHRVKVAAEAEGVVFLSSAFEYETVGWQTALNVCATKIASRAAPYLDAFKDAPRPLLVSNGMAPVLPAPDRIILQCEANYPSSAYWNGVYPGFSDHSGDPHRPIDAIKRGCRLLEVHFYIEPGQAGPDYPAALTLVELQQVCDSR